MRKKDLFQLVAAAVATVAGATVGIVLMAVSGKKINERETKEKN